MADTRLSKVPRALEFGVVTSTFLFGIATAQAYSYYSRFPHDRWQLKALVITVWLLELGHGIAIMTSLYDISILQYASGRGDKALTRAPNAMDAATLLSGSISSLVQVFFAERVRRFYGRPYGPYLAILCWFFTFLNFLSTIGATIVSLRASLVDLTQKWGWLITFSWVITAVGDILIAALLCYNLAKNRKSAFTRTTRMVDRIIATTIRTGLVTSLTALAVVICFQTMPKNSIYLAIYVCLARVYLNTLLATLNNRTALREMKDHVHSIKFADQQNISDQAQQRSSDAVDDMTSMQPTVDTIEGGKYEMGTESFRPV